MHAILLAAVIGCPPGQGGGPPQQYAAPSGRQRVFYENRQRGVRLSFEIDDQGDEQFAPPPPQSFPRYEIRGHAYPSVAPSPYAYGSGGGGVRCGPDGAYPVRPPRGPAPAQYRNGNGNGGRMPYPSVRESYSR